MKRILYAVALLLVLTPTVGRAEELKIAAYNMHNLFDVFDDPYTQDEQTRVKPRDELEAIATTLRHIDADIAVLSEVENEGSLRAFAYEFLGDMGYDFIETGRTNDGRGIRLGILSRKPIESLTSYRYVDLHLPSQTRMWRFARDLTQVRLRVGDGATLNLFMVHFKSRRDGPDDPNSMNWRTAEVHEAQRRIGALLTANPHALVAMVGDFNSTLGGEEISYLLQKQGDAPWLIDVHAALDVDDRITYLEKPYRSTIDYILASPALAGRLIPGSARVIHDEQYTSGSDHAPLMATFQLD
jgi:endonuclease/exonuclease/phosphatase family metal-dependent hydrolase